MAPRQPTQADADPDLVEELASIRFGDGVLQQLATGTRLSAVKARKAVRERMGGTPGLDVFATLIVKALPVEAMDEGVIQRMDLRPFLYRLARAEGLSEALRSGAEERLGNLTATEVTWAAAEATAQGMPDPGELTAAVQVFNPDEVRGVPSRTGQVDRRLASRPPTWIPTTTTAPTADDAVTTTTTTATTAVPGPDGAAPPTAAPPTDATVPGDAGTFADRLGGYVPAAEIIATYPSTFSRLIQSPQFDPDEFRAAVNAGRMDIEHIQEQAEPKFDEKTGQWVIPADQQWGPVGVQVPGATLETPPVAFGDVFHPSRMVVHAANRARAKAGNGIGLVQARNWLKDQDEDDVATMQENLEKAGLLEPGYDKGNPFDRSTDEAWWALIKEAWQRDEPTDRVLAGRLRRVEEQRQVLERQARRDLTASFRPVDKRDVSATADEYAMEVIGRPLTEGEKAELWSFVVQKRATTVGRVLSGRVDPDKVAVTEGGQVVDELDAFQSRVDQMIDPERRVSDYDTAMNVIAKRWQSVDTDAGKRPRVLTQPALDLSGGT